MPPTSSTSDPLLDRPVWAPAWTPSADNIRHMRLMRWAVTVVLAAGLSSCVLRGADQPADPVLGGSTPSTPVDR